MKKFFKITLIIIFIFISSIFLIRALSPREIDDLHPLIKCEKEYVAKSDILWIIPKYKGVAISENKSWCEEIKSLNKTLGLHGYVHTYQEFKSENITQEHIFESIQIFEDCFGESPTMFKPPQLKISKNNKNLIKNNSLSIRTPLHQTIHKVYHCENTGTFSNKIHDLF